MLLSWVVYEGSIRQALHQLKYKRNLALGETLARQVFPLLKELAWPVDMVIPVPLGRKRLQERGYNQAGMVALPLAALQGWEYGPRALLRVRETRSQVGLTPAERVENVRGAFRAATRKVSGRAILLVDDIATTGSTLSSCGQALLEAGARDVYAFTLARALAGHHQQLSQSIPNPT